MYELNLSDTTSVQLGYFLVVLYIYNIIYKKIL